MAKETPISEIEDNEPHLVRSKLKKDLSVDGAAIKGTLQKIDEYAGHSPYGVITDSSGAGFPSVSRDAFAAARELSPYPQFKAHALVVTQSGIRLIVNFFLRTFPLIVPHKMFDNQSEASLWVHNEILLRSPGYIFRIQITVTGKVQGVFYRKTCAAEAEKLGVTGYVKNLPNGDVLVDAMANSETLLALLKWCKNGPQKAKVKEVSFEFITTENGFPDFSIK